MLRSLGCKIRRHGSVRFVHSRKSRATPLDAAAKLTSRDKLHGYRVESVIPVSDFDLVAVQLIHEKTGAQHLHVAKKDSNNCFSVGFRTTPMDSTGVPHILEHTTLCGSQKYPVRDPFFKMLSRSLSTFMNAYTANDWTMYPFSTQNTKDFQNLLSVYLDCVFFPKLREMDFRQEGWRLEHENPHDVNSPLTFKGVVFNEMKGVFANAENIFAQALQNRLYPSHTYSHVSGGWPLNIPDLTWEALKDFHMTHYHPSNARFYTYGDIPLIQHLEQINTVMEKFEQSTPSLEIPLEKRWKEMQEHCVQCGSDPLAADPEKQTTASISFLLSPITDPYESLVMSIVSQLLVDGPTSPFYEALLDANIGADYSPMTGHDSSTREASFSVGLQGIKETDIPRVKDIIWTTLEKVFSEGFPEERVKAMLHQIELGLKHQSSNFGLALILSVMSPWIHNADPVAMIQVNRNVERFKEDVKSPSFLKDKIQQYFLKNKHCLVLTMTPDPQYESKQSEMEQQKLKAVVSSLTDEEKTQVYHHGLELLADQSQQSNSDCLPTLLTSDVDRHIQYTKLEHDQAGGVPVQYTEQPTNGLTYFRALSGISLIPENMKIYVPLFCSIITRMGAGDLDHRQFAQQCDLYTSGLSVSPHVSSHHTTQNGFEQGILFSSHCLDTNLPYMLALWEDIFTAPNLNDQDRLRTLIRMTASGLAMSVASGGHNFAVSASASTLSPASALSEVFSGLTQVEFLRQVAEMEDLTEVIHKLGFIAAEVLDCGSLRCAINTSTGNLENVSKAMEGFIDSIPGSRTDISGYTEDDEFKPFSKNVHHKMPFPVNFAGQSFRTVPYTHEDAPRLRVLARLLGSKYLHREIREKGGAYGSGVRQGGGVFSFFSYRDPNSVASLKVFQDSISWGTSGDFSSQDVEESKLSVFSQIDAPVSPGAKGSTVFQSGITDELRQRYRELLLLVSKQDLTDVANKYLHGDYVVKSSAIIGPETGDLLGPDWTYRGY